MVLGENRIVQKLDICTALLSMVTEKFGQLPVMNSPILLSTNNSIVKITLGGTSKEHDRYRDSDIKSIHTAHPSSAAGRQLYDGIVRDLAFCRFPVFFPKTSRSQGHSF
ncbi:hypothetical protein RRG08_036755 [Elysia crispata]|uniref:Uncharacterized protein n=1 Tax=Elysia crispata TaxID=231223 RepID=A0AAE0Y929_9GAST|nr:hypothetical protein RRG08_036755 [Elysia crispata]